MYTGVRTKLLFSRVRSRFWGFDRCAWDRINYTRRHCSENGSLLKGRWPGG